MTNGLQEITPDMLQAFMNQQQGQGTKLVGADDDVRYHEHKWIAVPKGMSMEHVADVATRKAEEMNKVHNFQHSTRFRPWDGAYAATAVMKEMFGMTIGKSTYSFFGENPPEFRTIDIDFNTKAEVPWGALEIPALEGATFHFMDGHIQNVGPVFRMVVRSPKKHKEAIEDFFRAVDDKLARESIYRGKPLLGAYELEFMNIWNFRANEIVFADDVQHAVDASIFTVVEHTEATIRAGLPTKRAVLAYGPYGTGKSSLGLIAAQRATKAGWTFLSAKAGKDQLKPVFETAKQYEPAVVFIEDIDNYTPSTTDGDSLSELLDLFDGVASKSSKLLVLMTTNHIDRIPAGMLRPGRLDYVLEVSGLDRNGTERLLKAVIHSDLLDADVDYDAVYQEMTDWQPAWIRAVADRCQSFAIARTDGELSYTITTDDLVYTARSMKPQLELMSKASEGTPVPVLETALQNTVSDAVSKAVDNWAIVDRDDDKVYELTAKPAGVDWMAQP